MGMEKNENNLTPEEMFVVNEVLQKVKIDLVEADIQSLLGQGIKKEVNGSANVAYLHMTALNIFSNSLQAIQDKLNIDQKVNNLNDLKDGIKQYIPVVNDIA
jgi:hypothetical protein